MRLTSNAAGRWRFESFGELIGYDGENLAYQVRIAVDESVEAAGWDWYADFEYSDGTKAPLPLLLQEDTLTATVTKAYLIPGAAIMQLRAVQGEIVKKTNYDRVMVEWAINATEELEAPEQDFWDEYAAQVALLRNEAAAFAGEAETQAERAERAADRGPYIGEGGYWYVWDNSVGDYANSGVFSGGEAPYIGANGNWFIGPEDSGVSAAGAPGPRGERGEQGLPGERGPQGIQGEQGLQGERGEAFTYEDFTSAQLEALRGPQGLQGIQGERGLQGERGQSGERGPQGDPGTAATVKVGSVTTGAAGSNAAVTNSGNANAAVLNFTIPRGATGERGPQGDPGADGKSFTVNGRYDTLAALKAAHPSGSAGEAYAVGSVESNIIYVWNDDLNDWDPIGALQGPVGPAGADGKDGQDGAQGAPGADGVSVTSVTQTTTSNADGGTNVITVTLSNGQTFTFNVKNGSKGSQGEPGADGKDGQDGAPGANGKDGQDGAQGEQGPAGPNQVSTSTATNISGLLKGNGSAVSAAVAGTDYTTPANVDTRALALLNRSNAVNAANTNYTTVMARGIALAREDQAGSVSVPNGCIVLVFTQ